MRLIVYFVLFFLALALAALVANALMEDNGYVLVNFMGFEGEMSFPGLILVLVALYFLIRLTSRLLSGVFGLGKAAQAHRVRQARKKTARGLLDISEGHFARGEKLLARSAHKSDTPVLNYLGAARAAQLQGAKDRRDNWLLLASEFDETSNTAVLLTQAELQLADRQYEQALATMTRLEETAPNHPQSARLLASIHRKLGDWAALEKLLPRLQRNKDIGAAERDALTEEVYSHRLDDAAKAGDGAQLEASWASVPKAHRALPALVHRYVKGLVDCGANPKAEAFIRKALKREWDDELVRLYGRLASDKPQSLLAQAERWLNTRGDDATLLLTAARLSSDCELWGKARSYLETSLAIRPDADSYRVYGELLERLGERAPAIDAFRTGLALATGKPIAAPALSPPVPVEPDVATTMRPSDS